MSEETKNTNVKRDSRGFSKIDRVIKSTAKNHNLENALYKHKALKHWQEVVAAFVEEASKLTQAIDFKKGVLVVACLSNEVAYKIKQLSDKIISALNEVLGRRVIFAIYLEK